MSTCQEYQNRFLSLYEPVHERFSRYCLARTGNRDAARELMSETVLRAYEKLDRLRNEGAFLHFLFGIAHRVNLSQWKRQNREKQLAEEDFEVIAPGLTPEDAMDVRLLHEALLRLPAVQREAIVLFEISGFSIKEIKAIQGGSLSAVKSRLTRGREKLKKWLTDPEEQFTTASGKAARAFLLGLTL